MWPPSVASRLASSNALVLQDSDHHTPIVGLAFRRGVRCDLPASTHRAGSQNIGQWNSALLLKKIGYVVGTFGAELLVQSGRPHRRCVTLNLNHIAVDGLRFLCQLQQLRFVLWFNVDLAVGKEDSDFTQNVVLTEFSKPLVCRSNGSLVSGDFLLLGG